MIDSAATLKRTACTRDCGDACSMIATVQNGLVTHLQSDPDHPVTQGFLCHRTSRFLERQYDPSRLTTPLIRRDGQLQPATWDEALGRIAEPSPEVVRGLALAVRDTDTDVRRNAAVALGRLGTGAVEALPMLQQALSDKSDKVRNAASAAVSKVAEETRRAA